MVGFGAIMKFNLKFIGGDNPKLKMRIHLVDQERALKVGRALVAFMNRKPSYGVAANQFGIMERVCAAKIQEPGRSGSTIRIFIDPQITNRSGSQTNIEGCLSWPGVTGKVKRPNELTVDWLAFKIFDSGKTVFVRQSESFKGFQAAILEHEIDHLDGIRCIDKMKNKKTR
jgi:peptide deformylase